MRALESTFSRGDSALGIHSGDLAKFRATADSCSTLNFAKSPTSNTAIPRILEEKSSLRADNALFPSLRDFALAKSWQSISAQADSSKASKAYFASAKFMDCHATATALARNDSKNATSEKADSRIFTQTAQSLSTPQGKKAESVFSNQPQAAGFLMKSATNLKTQQDSRICDEKSLLCERVQGRILGVCNRSTHEAIKDLSRKAES